MARLLHDDGEGGGGRPFAIELTERDPALALRGFIISRTGVLPTDPSFRALSDNDELLHFTAHWLQKREDDWFKSLAKILGVLWTRQDVKAMTGSKKSSVMPAEAFIPLSVGVNPEIVKGLQKMFAVGSEGSIGGGEYVPSVGEKVVELGDLPRDEFAKFINTATDTMREVAHEMEEKQRLVNVKEKPTSGDDPRLKRAMDQIAHSKRFR